MTGTPLTRQHFQLLATALAQAAPDEATTDAYEQWRRDVSAISAALSTTNGAYQPERFLRAAGVAR